MKLERVVNHRMVRVRHNLSLMSSGQQLKVDERRPSLPSHLDALHPAATRQPRPTPAPEVGQLSLLTPVGHANSACYDTILYGPGNR